MFSLGLFESESSLNLTGVPIPSVPKGDGNSRDYKFIVPEISKDSVFYPFFATSS